MDFDSRSRSVRRHGELGLIMTVIQRTAARTRNHSVTPAALRVTALGVAVFMGSIGNALTTVRYRIVTPRTQERVVTAGTPGAVINSHDAQNERSRDEYHHRQLD